MTGDRTAAGAGAPYLAIEGLTKSFGAVRVLEGLTLELAEGEILALLGLSGSGKTTALRLLAGFETADAGTLHVAGREVSRMPARERGFGMVFQHYALFPHMTVAENVAFGLAGRGLSKPELTARVEEALRLVSLDGLGARRPAEISGGQQQRVALARALAPEPRLLLLDEPLSNLDPALREQTRQELRTAVERVGITTVLVTHEQEEAFHLGDRVAVLHEGRLEQVGSPVDLYRRPASRFVASFVGRSGSLPGRVERAVPPASSESRVLDVRLEEGATWQGAVAESAELEAFEVGAPVELVLRPEALTLAPLHTPGTLTGRVMEIRFTGPLTYALVEPATSPGERLPVRVPDATPPPAVDTTVAVARRPDGPMPRIFAASPSSSS